MSDIRFALVLVFLTRMFGVIFAPLRWFTAFMVGRAVVTVLWHLDLLVAVECKSYAREEQHAYVFALNMSASDPYYGSALGLRFMLLSWLKGAPLARYYITSFYEEPREFCV